jgi:hypothetical protein
MMLKKHIYLFSAAFHGNGLYYLFFSESGEFDDGFAYPIKAQTVLMKFENDPDVRVDAKGKLQLLTLIADINIILSYRHNKWSEDDINTPLSYESKLITNYKIFWNRDSI